VIDELGGDTPHGICTTWAPSDGLDDHEGGRGFGGGNNGVGEGGDRGGSRGERVVTGGVRRGSHDDSGMFCCGDRPAMDWICTR
jgi:hypothetical protein